MPPFLMEKIIHVIQVQENRLVFNFGRNPSRFINCVATVKSFLRWRFEGLTLEKSALKKTLR